MSFTTFIKADPRLKKIVHWMIVVPGEARPRIWVKWFVNPFLNQRGKKSRINWRTRMDILPFNKFHLGNGSVIEDFSTINNGVGDVIIGDNTFIGLNNVLIGPLRIGNNVIFAQNIVISGLNHGYQDINLPISQQKVTVADIIVEDDCWIGANAVITAGVKIGKHSVIAAGAVVTKDVPAFSVAGGNPSRILKRYDHVLEKWEKV